MNELPKAVKNVAYALDWMCNQCDGAPCATCAVNQIRSLIDAATHGQLKIGGGEDRG